MSPAEGGWPPKLLATSREPAAHFISGGNRSGHYDVGRVMFRFATAGQGLGRTWRSALMVVPRRRRTRARRVLEF
jgi:hypothetical protein